MCGRTQARDSCGRTGPGDGCPRYGMGANAQGKPRGRSSRAPFDLAAECVECSQRGRASASVAEIEVSSTSFSRLVRSHPGRGLLSLLAFMPTGCASRASSEKPGARVQPFDQAPISTFVYHRAIIPGMASAGHGRDRGSSGADGVRTADSRMLGCRMPGIFWPRSLVAGRGGMGGDRQRRPPVVDTGPRRGRAFEPFLRGLLEWAAMSRHFHPASVDVIMEYGGVCPPDCRQIPAVIHRKGLKGANHRVKK